MAMHRDRDDRERNEQAGDILGITREVTPDSAVARDRTDVDDRRRRSDDLMEDATGDRDPLGGPGNPPGLHVED